MADPVGTAIDGATFLGNKAISDERNLLSKLAAAEAKAAEGKNTDAVLKLEDLADTALALANAPKPKLEGADDIVNAVETAIACLAGR